MPDLPPAGSRVGRGDESNDRAGPQEPAPRRSLATPPPDFWSEPDRHPTSLRLTIGLPPATRHQRADRPGVGQPTPGRRPRPGASRDRYTAAVPLSVITFQFDPLAHVGDWNVRWETIGIAVAIFVALVAAAVLAGRARLPARPTTHPGRAATSAATTCCSSPSGSSPGR